MSEIEKLSPVQHEHNTFFKGTHPVVLKESAPDVSQSTIGQKASALKKEINDDQLKSLLSLLEQQGMMIEGSTEQEKITFLKQAIIDSGIDEPELVELLDLAEKEKKIKAEEKMNSLATDALEIPLENKRDHKKKILEPLEYRQKITQLFDEKSREPGGLKVEPLTNDLTPANASPSKLAALTVSSKALMTQGVDKTKTLASEAGLYLKKDRSQDGHFSGIEATKEFGKGIAFPIRFAFSSPQNFITALGLLFAGHRFAKMGGAPILSALGTTFAGVTLFQGGKQLITAKDGDEREKSFYKLGMGTVGLYGIGSAKPALRSVGVEPKSNSLVAGVQTYKEIPRSLKMVGKNTKLMLEKAINAIKVFSKTPSSIKNVKIFSKRAPALPVPNPAGLNMNLAADKQKPAV